MESGRLFFDPSACQGLFLGNGDHVFRGPRSMMNMEETGSERRPFFSSPEEYFDEEFYDEQLHGKKRRLTAEQVLMLEKSFESQNKLEPERKTQLAKKLGLQPRQVAVWFQNRRARWKAKQLERDYDLLKASYDSLLSNYDSVVKENEKLKTEVISLTEKLQSKEVTAATEEKPESPQDVTGDLPALQLTVKVEDRLSSGSTESAIVDDDGPQLVDSGDSYFPYENYVGCIVPADAMNSEEDEGSDDGQNYFPHAFVAAEQQNEEAEAMGWPWVWS